MLVGIGLNLSSNALDAPFDLGEVIKKLFEQHPHGGGQIVLGVCQTAPDVSMEAASAAPHRQTIFEAEGTRLVHQRRSPSDKTITDAMEGLCGRRVAEGGVGAPHGVQDHRQLARHDGGGGLLQGQAAGNRQLR